MTREAYLCALCHFSKYIYSMKFNLTQTDWQYRAYKVIPLLYILNNLFVGYDRIIRLFNQWICLCFTPSHSQTTVMKSHNLCPCNLVLFRAIYERNFSSVSSIKDRVDVSSVHSVIVFCWAGLSLWILFYTFRISTCMYVKRNFMVLTVLWEVTHICLLESYWGFGRNWCLSLLGCHTSTLKMLAEDSSERLVPVYLIIWRHIPEATMFILTIAKPLNLKRKFGLSKQKRKSVNK
jgi:hypothetical protein